MTFNIEISQFYDYSEHKQQKLNKIRHFFNGTYSDLALLFIGCKILKYFNDFSYWHFSVSLQKWAQTNKVK